MKTKRLFQALMLVVAGFTLFACGKKEEPKPEDPTPVDPEEPTHEHAFGQVVYSWANDNSKVTATRLCECGEKQEEIVNATSAEKTAATCLTNQVLTYTSAAFTNQAFTVQTKDVEVPDTKLSHQFSEPQYVWNDDNSSVTASRACTREGCTYVEDEVALAEELSRTTAKCGVNVVVTYKTADFVNTAFAAQTKEVEIPDTKLTHNLVLVPEVEATCVTSGVKAYYACDREGCGALFEDIEGLSPIGNLDAWKAEAGKIEPHHTASGSPTGITQVEGVWYNQEKCSVCSADFLDPIETHNTEDCKLAAKEAEISNVALTVAGFCGTNGFAQSKIAYLVAFDGKRAMTLKTTNECVIDGYTITIHDHKVELGDTMLVETIVREGNYYMSIKVGSKVTFGEKVDVSKFDADKIISIKDKTTETNMYAYDIGGIYKFTATAENPLYINGLRSTSGGVEYNFLSLFAAGNGKLNAETLAGNDKVNMRYTNTSNQNRTLGSVIQFWKLNLGQQWLADNFDEFTINQETGELEGTLRAVEDSIPLGKYAFTGTCYLYTMYAGTAGENAYQTCYVLPIGFNLTKVTQTQVVSE